MIYALFNKDLRMYLRAVQQTKVFRFVYSSLLDNAMLWSSKTELRKFARKHRIPMNEFTILELD